MNTNLEFTLFLCFVSLLLLARRYHRKLESSILGCNRSGQQDWPTEKIGWTIVLDGSPFGSLKG